MTNARMTKATPPSAEHTPMMASLLMFESDDDALEVPAALDGGWTVESIGYEGSTLAASSAETPVVEE